jgi:hypothetical protein
MSSRIRDKFALAAQLDTPRETLEFQFNLACCRLCRGRLAGLDQK